MTPNKLPPLPEPDITDGNHRLFPEYGRGCSGYSAEQVRFITGSLQAKIDMLMLEYCPDEMTPEQMETWAAHQVPSSAAEAEALRQSQSLPAGAVAGLVGKWRGEVIELVETPRNETQRRGNALAKNYNCALTACADELEQALQADAREKGEAASGKVNGYLFSQRAIEVIVDGEIPEWMSRQPGIRVTITPEGATQPAQASEAVSYAVAEDTLDRYVALAPSGDHWPPERLKALRVEAMRTAMQNAALATSSQETASE